MRKPRTNFKASDSQRELIKELGSKGMPDEEIAKQMKVPRSTVTYITTKYWADKMKEKYESA